MYFQLILLLTKIINGLISTFKLGSGHTWPGHLALKLYPNILADSHIKFKKGVIIISGTNGKTTTAKILTHILTAEGLKVVNNATGANLLNGVVSAVLLRIPLFDKDSPDIAVFEVDEFALPDVLSYLNPSILILLNLSRDQLDRYGEVDIIFDRWKEALSKLGTDTVIVCDSLQPEFVQIAQIFAGPVRFFSASDDFVPLTKLRGSFNTGNLNAALVAIDSLGLDKERALKHMNSFLPAYGRGETIAHKGIVFHIFLAKNPVSFNNNLKMSVFEQTGISNVLIILNDKIPDGRDVSWIYDIEATLLKKVLEGKKVFVAGTRRLDMIIRLEYAGVVVQKTVKHLTFDKDVREVLVLPNYSAMLALRKVLTGRKIL